MAHNDKKKPSQSQPPETTQEAPAAEQPNSPSALDAKIKEIKEKLAPKPETTPEQYEAKIAELNDKMLRVAADAQNVKRRAEIDVTNAKTYSIESFAKDLVSVLENLYRAADTIPAEEQFQNIKEGVEMTKKELLRAFERQQIRRIDPKGEAFDHNYHQAISQVPAPDVAPGTVVDVVQAGYVLKDRLLRPAMVVVAKGE